MGVPEIVNSMRLKSALEDFESNSLGVVPGVLHKLSYVGSLQDSEGNYEHWGLSKVYGSDAAGRAIATSHQGLFSEVLRKPLAMLFRELALTSGEPPAEFLARLSQASPKPLSPSAQAHLKAVLKALSALLESPNAANLQDASRPPQPGP